MRSNRYTSMLLAIAAGVTLAFAPESSPEIAEAPTPVLPHVAAVAAAAMEPAAPAIDEDALLVQKARAVLEQYVVERSHPDALGYALTAYYQFREENPGRVRKPYFYFVDFGLPSTEPRGYVFDMDALKLVDGPFTVAHGRGSARGTAPIPTTFSNRPGSNATSLGLFVAAETYSFRGKSGGRPYRSIGLRMDGVSGGFNSAARRRGIVAHGAPYVTPDKAGRSEGCPALEPARAEKLLPMLSGGSLVFLFSPNDREWMRLEPWVDVELATTMPNPRMASVR